MPRRSAAAELAALKRLADAKTRAPVQTPRLGPEMVQFFKQSVQKRQTRLGAIGECWGRLVPELLSDHCSLEALHRGTLSVVVDSSSHLYELKQLLLAGLERQLLLACKSAGLRKIALKQGRWYEQTDDGRRNARFR